MVAVGHTVGVSVVELVIAVVGDQLKAGRLLLKVMVQPVIFPEIRNASSIANNCHVPLVVQPFKRVNESSGMNVPVKGGEPDAIGVTAVGVKQVLV